MDHRNSNDWNDGTLMTSQLHVCTAAMFAYSNAGGEVFALIHLR